MHFVQPDSPLRLLSLTVLADRWMEMPSSLDCGNLKSWTWPSVLSTYTSRTVRQAGRTRGTKLEFRGTLNTKEADGSRLLETAANTNTPDLFLTILLSLLLFFRFFFFFTPSHWQRCGDTSGGKQSIPVTVSDDERINHRLESCSRGGKL